MSHANAPLTVEGRRRLCLRVDAGRPHAHVAAEAGVSRQCLSKWHARWRAEGEAGLADRSSRPAHSPGQVPLDVQGRIERLRRERKLGPARIAAELRTQGVTISASGCTGCWPGSGSAGYVIWTGPPVSSCADPTATSVTAPVS